MACLSRRLRRRAIWAWYSTATCHSEPMWISSLDDNFAASEAVVAGLSTVAPPSPWCSSIVSILDYCNSLFLLVPPLTTWTNYNVSSTARLVRYTAADVPTTSPRYRLHWLRIREWIAYKLCVLVYTRRSTNQHRHIYRSCVRRLLSLFHVVACVPRGSVHTMFQATVRQVRVFTLRSDNVECPACRVTTYMYAHLQP